MKKFSSRKFNSSPGRRSIQRLSGFTIVETLVAIAILMIAIAGPLSIATKGLTTALNAKNQMIAIFLAQETMERVKNFKDNNIALPAPSWVDVISGATNGAPYDIGGIDSNAVSCPTVPTIGCSLYIDPSLGYTNDTSLAIGSPLFKRYFYLSQPTGNAPCTSADQECVVRVVVSWRQGSTNNQVALVDVITNSTR